MEQATEYQEFLKDKNVRVNATGFDVSIDEIDDTLFDFQKTLVKWALRRGRAAIWADTGLGKTLMQLEWAKHLPCNVLILAPLAVAQQTVTEAEKLGMTVQYCRSQGEAKNRVVITNYEMLHAFDPTAYGGIVLDESSILKSYMGKTKQALINAFRDTPFRLCCTATPAPNDLLEIGNHADFLGVMPSNEMIARWFINNPGEAGNYRLKHHGEKDFWSWVASWAMSVVKPSNIGGNDEGFNLPPLDIITHNVETEAIEPPEGQMFDVSRPSATKMHRQKRHTALERALGLAGIVNESDEKWVLWCDTNYEADELVKAIPDAIEVRGNETIRAKESKLVQFGEGKARVIISKPDIAGFGLNWQHCHNVGFIGLSYSYEKFYQAIRRCWRFGQKSPVNVHVMTSQYDTDIDNTIWLKAENHKKLKTSIIDAVKETQMDELGLNRQVVKAENPELFEGENWQLWQGDCVAVTSQLESESVGFSIHSPPFGNLYIYSDSASDMGNSKDDGEFFQHYEYLIPELHRITVPGRLAAVHCKDLPMYKGRDGAAGLRDFPGQIVRSFERHGWVFHSRVTIWKDPVTEMQRTKSYGLLHKQLCADSTASRQGMADYLLVFRKWNEAGKFSDPVNGGSPDHRFEPDEYIGEEGPSGSRSTREYSIQVWQRYASPVWFDINQFNVLNYQIAKTDKDEKHIAPLQLDVIARAIQLWSNEGDTVFSPFAGIGSEGYGALSLNRKSIGVELKPEYCKIAVKNYEKALSSRSQSSMFGQFTEE